jgi:hypothetical protein
VGYLAFEVPYYSFRNIALRKNTHPQAAGLRAREARRAIPSEQGANNNKSSKDNEKIEEKKEIFIKNHKGLLFFSMFLLREGSSTFPKHPHYVISHHQ